MKKSLLLSVFLFVFFVTNYGQSVGLVLSGGGAKGIAHIGVLRALEEHNIPVDYVAGTSIGAIVGGLYAIGYSPDEMEELFKSDEFYDWAQGVINTEEKYYFKLKDEDPGWLNAPFENNEGKLSLKLPSYLISPAQMDLRFLQFFEPGGAAANADFDSLMVPYFSVATDVINRKAKIMDSGSLAQAVRASMAFPAVFKPVVADDLLLFDGGMKNNFPTNIMQDKFNPDFLIGVQVGRNAKIPKVDELYSQIEYVFMEHTSYEMPENGILLRPEVFDFQLLDFEYFDTLSALGYAVANKKMDSIKMVIKRRVSPQDLAAKRKDFKSKYREIIFKDVYVNGVSEEMVEYILRSVRKNRETISMDEFEVEYFKLLSEPLIHSIYPRAEFNAESGLYDLYLDVATRTKLSFSVGGNVSSNLRSMAFFGMDYYFQKKNIYHINGSLSLGRFYNAFNGGIRMDFPPRPLAKNELSYPFYVSLEGTVHKWDYFTSTQDWFIDNNSLSNITEEDSYFNFDFGGPISMRSLFYTGFTFGKNLQDYYFINGIESTDEADQTKFNYTSLHLTFEHNSLNRKQYSNEGRITKFKTRYVTGSEKYYPGTTSGLADRSSQTDGHSWINVNLKYEQYFKFGSVFTLGTKAEGNYSSMKPFANSIATQINTPVFQPFPQTQSFFVENFRSTSYVGFGVLPIFNVTDNLHFRTEGYLFQPYQYVLTDTFEPNFSEKMPKPRFMGSLAFVWHTSLGPLAATGSYFMEEQKEWYFQLNFGYLLFNKKGLD